MRYHNLFAAILFAAACSARADVIYVDVDATGANNGSSWANAYVDLDDALAVAAAGDQVWVAEGNYYPPFIDTPFDLLSGVKVYGGFDGTETSLEERDFVNHLTVINGDYNGNDQPGFVNRADNAYRLMQVLSPASGTRLDGLVFAGGYANTLATPSGGAIYQQGGTLVIDNCLFIANGALLDGGAVYCVSTSQTKFKNTVFTGNATNPTATGCQGGGISFRDGGTLHLEGCVFALNLALANTSSFGGAIAILDTDEVKVIDCEFVANVSEAGTSSRGGAIYISNSSMDVLRSRFVQNIGNAGTGSSGGAIQHSGRTTANTINLVACELLDNSADVGAGFYSSQVTGGSVVRIADSVVAGNDGESTSGVVIYSDAGLLNIQSSTIAFNTTSSFPIPVPAGVFVSSSIPATIKNSILWGNDYAGVTDEAAQVGGTVTPDIHHCNVQGWTGAYGGTGNFGADPLFFDPDGPDDILGNADDIFTLGPFSPCIDAGDNTSIPADTLDLDDDGDTSEPLPLDLYLRDRQVDDIDVADTGSGTAPIVDIGAVEFQLRSCPADMNFDGQLDFFDVLEFLTLFDAFDPAADLTGDGIHDFFDVLLFLALFSAGCP